MIICLCGSLFRGVTLKQAVAIPDQRASGKGVATHRKGGNDLPWVATSFPPFSSLPRSCWKTGKINDYYHDLINRSIIRFSMM